MMETDDELWDLGDSLNTSKHHAMHRHGFTMFHHLSQDLDSHSRKLIYRPGCFIHLQKPWSSRSDVKGPTSLASGPLRPPKLDEQSVAFPSWWADFRAWFRWFRWFHTIPWVSRPSKQCAGPDCGTFGRIQRLPNRMHLVGRLAHEQWNNISQFSRALLSMIHLQSDGATVYQNACCWAQNFSAQIAAMKNANLIWLK